MGFLDRLLDKGSLRKPLHFTLEKIMEEYVPDGEMPPYTQELKNLISKDNLKLKDVAELAVLVRNEMDHLKDEVDAYVVVTEKAKRVQSILDLWNEILSGLTSQFSYQEEVTDTEAFIHSKAVEDIPHIHHAITELLTQKNELQLESQLVLQAEILQKSIYNLEQTLLTLMPEIINIKDKKRKLEEEINQFQDVVEELRQKGEPGSLELSVQTSEKGKLLVSRKKSLTASEKDLQTYVEAVQKTAIQIFLVFQEVSESASDSVKTAIDRLIVNNEKILKTAADSQSFLKQRKKLSQLTALLQLLNDCIHVHQKYDR